MDFESLLHDSALHDMIRQGARILNGDLGDWAIQYAALGYPIFPLQRGSKAPATRNGLYDATTEFGKIHAWWRRTHVDAGIGLRVPEDMIVIDIDPRNGGEAQFRRLTTKYGNMPETMVVYSGRGDGGRHYYLRKQDPYDGELRVSTQGLKRELGIEKIGIDVKTSKGYVVAPPSLHPETGKPYTVENFGMHAECPEWLWYRLTHDEAPRPKSNSDYRYDDSSPADWFTAHTTWNQILEPHGWNVVGYDGDSDGSMWKHPAATSPLSATIRHTQLFVYSPNTPFEITEAATPHGYTRFRAWAVLNYNGDMTSAAIAVAMARMKGGL